MWGQTQKQRSTQLIDSLTTWASSHLFYYLSVGAPNSQIYEGGQMEPILYNILGYCYFFRAQTVFKLVYNIYQKTK